MSDATLEKVLEAFRDPRRVREGVRAWKHFPAQPGHYVDFPPAIDAGLCDVLRQGGIERLYSHQSEAIQAVLEGKNVVVVTPTASGKTLCYNLPVVQKLITEPESRALYLFPTKALSQDQLNELHGLTTRLERDIKVYTFDGDTPQKARRSIRSAGHIVVTNPDMLHTGILPHHTLWIRLFENLSFVVVDEIHHYRGVFGSHLANVIRRLKRICRFYGSNPQFICCSATIANPKEMAEQIVGENFALIDKNGSPQGERHFVFYTPPVVNRELGIRRSVTKEATRIASRFIYDGIQTIVFARSRLRVEILTKYLKRITRRFLRNPEAVKGYRGGYLPNERREIEKGVKSGEILGVISTNALELGIDIGSLTVSIMAGYPGTVASTWQQGGRAGRRSGAAAIILIASSDPLDQYIVNHPEYFFGSSPESGIVNPNNVQILASHLKCGAFELPFDDGERFGEVDVSGALRFLEEQRILRHTGGRWYWMSDVYPAEQISLRSAAAENFVILNKSRDNQVLGEVDYPSAPLLVHEEAIYIHQSQTYHIDQLDWDRRIAYAREVNSDYYTDAQEKTDIKILAVDDKTVVPVDPPGGTDTENTGGIPDGEPPFEDEKIIPLSPRPEIQPSLSPRLVGEIVLDADLDLPPEDAAAGPDVTAHYMGAVAVTTVPTAYKKIRFETHENVGFGEIDLPELELQTESYWLSFGSWTPSWAKSRGIDLSGGLRGLATVLHNVIPLFVMCDPKDIRAISMAKSPQTRRPSIYVYDRYPGGIGISHKVYEIRDDVLRAARELMKGCACPEGCPSCVGATLEVGSKAKAGASALLDLLQG